MILSTEIEIIVANQKVKHYKELGYDAKGTYPLLVKIEHLSKGSNNHIEVKCDICGNEKSLSYKKYLQNIKKYNVYSCSQSCAQFKNKKTCLEKYGVEHNWKNKECRDKALLTGIKRYGTSNNIEKIKRTNLKKYGVTNVLNNEKSKQTKLKKYGNINYVETEDFKNKAKESFIKKYGVDHPMKNLEYYENHIKKCFKFKEYKLPSGKIVKVQGYEPLVLNELFKLGYKENDLIIKTSEINREIGLIKYVFNNKEHRYYPDIYIKSENRIIEVKSMRIFNLHKEKNLAKRKACLAKNLNFNFFIR